MVILCKGSMFVVVVVLLLLVCSVDRMMAVHWYPGDGKRSMASKIMSSGVLFSTVASKNTVVVAPPPLAPLCFVFTNNGLNALNLKASGTNRGSAGVGVAVKAEEHNSVCWPRSLTLYSSVGSWYCSPGSSAASPRVGMESYKTVLPRSLCTSIRMPTLKTGWLSEDMLTRTICNVSCWPSHTAPKPFWGEEYVLFW